MPAQLRQPSGGGAGLVGGPAHQDRDQDQDHRQGPTGPPKKGERSTQRRPLQDPTAAQSTQGVGQAWWDGGQRSRRLAPHRATPPQVWCGGGGCSHLRTCHRETPAPMSPTPSMTEGLKSTLTMARVTRRRRAARPGCALECRAVGGTWWAAPPHRSSATARAHLGAASAMRETTPRLIATPLQRAGCDHTAA